MILALNGIALFALVWGALNLTDTRQALIAERQEALRLTGETIVSLLAEVATGDDDRARLDEGLAGEVMRQIQPPGDVRIRLYAVDGRLIQDTDLVTGLLLTEELPPLDAPAADPIDEDLFGGETPSLLDDLETARSGRVAAGPRRAEDGDLLVSVTLPVRRVQAVLGMLMLESRGVEQVLAGQRRSQIPFISLAITVFVATSLILVVRIARPIRKLAEAADQIRREGPKKASIPDLAKNRRDEIADLSKSMAAMTNALSHRIDAIESFAADVAHELKNPLTSIRSAVETLPLAHDDDSRERLLAVMTHDVGRLDRLITDISRASRVDAELARAEAEPLDLAEYLTRMVDFYAATRKDGQPEVRLDAAAEKSAVVLAQADAIGHVVRNLIDNAKSFSPSDKPVWLRLTRETGNGRAWTVLRVEDSGPGLPEDARERVFERFYTQRPSGEAFGAHSGLGLAIAKQIIEAHGGAIAADNRTDPTGVVLGARFEVRLPAAHS